MIDTPDLTPAQYEAQRLARVPPAAPQRIRLNTQSHPVTVRGKRYPSMAEAYREMGITPDRMQAMKRKR